MDQIELPMSGFSELPEVVICPGGLVSQVDLGAVKIASATQRLPEQLNITFCELPF